MHSEAAAILERAGIPVATVPAGDADVALAGAPAGAPA
jgi:hypothetical protein